jgi:hypothetical protein
VVGGVSKSNVLAGEITINMQASWELTGYAKDK